MKKPKPARKAKKQTGPQLPIVYSEDLLYKVGITSGLRASAKLPVGQRTPVVISGVVLPGNLVEVATDCGNETGKFYSELVAHDRVGPGKDFADEVDFISKSNRSSLEKGFVLAILRYADELKSNPEAAAMLAANRANSKKGTAAIKRKSEPKKREARRLDLELRKNKKFHKKYLRVEQIAEQMKISTRTVQTYLSD